MKSSKSDAPDTPDVLALTLPEAVRRLESAGFTVDVVETRPPRRALDGSLRVLAVRRPEAGRVVVVAGRGPNPVGACEGG